MKGFPVPRKIASPNNVFGLFVSLLVVNLIRLLGLDDDCGMANVTLAKRNSIHCHFVDAMEMDESSNDYKNVEYLM